MIQLKQWLQKQKTSSYFFIKQHLTLFLFVMILLIFGVIFGALIVGQLEATQKEDLKGYLQSFFGMMHTDVVANPSDIFQTSVWNHLKMVGFIWILGISIVGCPLILFFLFLKGAMLGFSVGLLVSEFGMGGFLMSFGTIFPQNLFIIPLWLIMVTLALSFSLEMMKYIAKRTRLPIGKKMMRYNLSFMMIGISFSFPTLYEAFISPKIITLVVEKIFL